MSREIKTFLALVAGIAIACLGAPLAGSLLALGALALEGFAQAHSERIADLRSDLQKEVDLLHALTASMQRHNAKLETVAVVVAELQQNQAVAQHRAGLGL